MNERIKELKNQAWIQPTYIDCNGKECNHSPDVYPSYFSPDKFAELIVKECAKIATYPQLGDEESYYGNEFAKAIKKHFGVEE